MRVSILALLAALAMPAPAARNVLWSIGTPDLSSAEFGAIVRRVVYEPGKSSPATDWRRTQSPNGEPFAIRFRLERPPAGTYELNVSVLFHDPNVPQYKVTVNGKSGSFWLRPEAHEVVNEADLNVLPYPGTQRLKIGVPARLLRSGINEILLGVSGGSLDYDALSFEQDSEGAGGTPRARIEPTVLWRRNAGVLCEDANLFLTPGALGAGGKVVVRIAGRTFTKNLPDDTELGEVLVPLSVPDREGRITPVSVQLETPAGQRTFALEFRPQRKWKLFVAPSTHLDIGYTTTQPKALEVHLQNLEQAALLAEKHPSFRWNVEGSWALQQFLDRGGTKAGKILDFLTSGARLGVNAFDFNLQAYLCSLEELNVATDRSYGLHERNGTPFQVATVTDVPSLPWSLPSILNRAGIRYLASGANQVRGPLLTYSGLDRSSPFFWEGPDGSRVLMWYTKSYAQVRRLFGIPGSAERARKTLDSFLSAFPARYPYDAALVYGYDGDNAPAGDGNADFFARWNEEYAYPQIEPARFEDFFAYIEKQGTANLPVFRGDGGAYWEDGAGESPITTAIHRRNQAGAVDLEKLISLAALRSRRFADAGSQVASIWEKILLFDEHTFGARAAVLRPDAPDTRLQWQMKSQFVSHAAGELRWKQLEWLERLNQSVPHPKDAVVVWNLENWSRSGTVEIQVPPGRAIYEATTRQLQASDILSSGDNASVMRFVARDVPPLGYKLYTLVAAETPNPGTGTNDPAVLENEFYRITLDPKRMGIAGIWDKQLGRELVPADGEYALGEYFRVRETSAKRSLAAGTGNNWYTGVRTRIDMNDPELPAPVLSVVRPAIARKREVRKTALGQEAILEGMLAGEKPVRLTIRLYSGLRRIDLTVKTTVDFGRDGHAEAAYVAFPFAVARPEFAYNLPVGWVNPAKDMLPGGATEWFAIDNAATVSHDGAVITVAMPDTPLITWGDINRGRWPKSFTPPSGANLFSYVMNNYWLTNFPAGQETGEAEFRYAITSGKDLLKAAQRRFGEEQRHPLMADFRPESAGASAPDPRESAVRVESGSVNVVTMKASRSGSGYVLRLVECDGKQSPATVQWNGVRALRKAFLCSLKEQKTRELAIRNGRIDLTLSPYALETVLLELQPE